MQRQDEGDAIEGFQPTMKAEQTTPRQILIQKQQVTQGVPHPSQLLQISKIVEKLPSSGQALLVPQNQQFKLTEAINDGPDDQAGRGATAARSFFAPISAISAIRPVSSQLNPLPQPAIDNSLEQVARAFAVVDDADDSSGQHANQERSLFKSIRRTRLDSHQTNVLESEYQLNVRWRTHHISSLAQRLGISHAKVYKWNYDKRKKDAAAAQATSRPPNWNNDGSGQLGMRSVPALASDRQQQRMEQAEDQRDE